MSGLYAVNEYGMDLYQQYIHISRYARFKDNVQRREIWPETVARYVNFFDAHTNKQFTDILNNFIKPYILNLESMPSMRALMTAGEALYRENVAAYNCSYLEVDEAIALAETLYILLCGTGVGFSCEQESIRSLPKVPKRLIQNDRLPIIVGDSKKGWALAYKEFIASLFNGVIRKVSTHKVRPAGARLKTFGGRASGPEPLRQLFKNTVTIFKQAAGRKLSSLEVHDLMCFIADTVVVGGVRRSALISLSDLEDKKMRHAKNGAYEKNPQRSKANNSVAYDSKPTREVFNKEWAALIASNSGERGIFNREAARKQAARWGRRDLFARYGCNPCSEIILLSKQFCNVTEVVVRPDDTLETLMKKVEAATIMGTLQTTLTKFDFISKKWVENTKKEALLGVSLTGIMDNAVMAGLKGKDLLKRWLNTLRDHARKVNAEWASKLGINTSAAITCIKPSGTVSQLVNCASGIHPRHNLCYIRTVRTDKKDPLYSFMKDKGFYVEDDLFSPDATAVISFPISAPAGALTRDSMTALEFLDMWLLYQREWCEHKPSVTITVKEHEWQEVGDWVYKHFDEVSGVSFLPHSNHAYKQAPYQALTPLEYSNWVKEHPIPSIDWADLGFYEYTDNTTGVQTLACTGGACEI